MYFFPEGCLECGYDLRGSIITRRCAECGFDYARPILFARPDAPIAMWKPVVGILACVFFLIFGPLLWNYQMLQPCICLGWPVASIGLIVALIVLIMSIGKYQHWPVLIMISDDGLAARNVKRGAIWQRWRWNAISTSTVMTAGHRIYLRVFMRNNVEMYFALHSDLAGAESFSHDINARSSR